eukprot:COSAG02_NODE_551_length_20435_cov_27.974380_7_plen_1096_part_01
MDPFIDEHLHYHNVDDVRKLNTSFAAASEGNNWTASFIPSAFENMSESHVYYVEAIGAWVLDTDTDPTKFVAQHTGSSRFIETPCSIMNLTEQRICTITASPRCAFNQDAISRIESLVKLPHTLDFDAQSIGEFLDGGDGLYDGGNRITTSLCPYDQLRPYVDGFQSVQSDCFGAGGDFTMNLGSSTLLLETVNTHSDDIGVYISGNLGSDGRGFAYSWEFQAGALRGYGKCVCGNRNKPNVNHFWIINSDLSPNVEHEVSFDTNDDFDRLSGIGPNSPIVYAVYASRNGACHWDAENEAIFLAAADSCASWSFGCGEEANRLVDHLSGGWSVRVRDVAVQASSVFAVDTRPYAVCFEDTIDRTAGTIRDTELLPDGAHVYVASCALCDDSFFLSSWRDGFNCSDAYTQSSGPGPDFTVPVVGASWSALNGEVNRDDEQAWPDGESIPSGDLSLALNGNSHWVSYRTASSAGFQVDLDLGSPSVVAGLSLLVNLEDQSEVGYSGLEIFVSTDGGVSFDSVYTRNNMFGSYDRYRASGGDIRTTYPAAADDFAFDEWYVHRFGTDRANVTHIRLITGAADQRGDNCLSFHSVRIDAAGAYGHHCEPACPNGFYTLEVETEWLAVTTITFDVRLPRNAVFVNASLAFGAPWLGPRNASATDDDAFFPAMLSVMVEDAAEISWSLSGRHVDRNHTTPVQIALRERNGTAGNFSEAVYRYESEGVFRTPSLTDSLNFVAADEAWVAGQTISVSIGVLKSSVADYTDTCAELGIAGTHYGDSCNANARCTYKDQGTFATCVATHTTACADIGIAGSNAGDDCTADPRCTYNDQGTAGDTTDDVCEAAAVGTCAAEAGNGISACTAADDCTYVVGDCTYDDGLSDDACEPTMVNLTAAFEWINAIPHSHVVPRLEYSAGFISDVAVEHPDKFSSCVPGCMDPQSFNYNVRNNEEDGSCVPIVIGCTNSSALNYDPNANVDPANGTNGTIVRGFLHLPTNRTVDPTCIPNVTGCMDPIADNFVPQATWEAPNTCVVSQCSAEQDAAAHPHANCTLHYIYDDDGVRITQAEYTCGTGEPSGGMGPQRNIHCARRSVWPWTNWM